MPEVSFMVCARVGEIEEPIDGSTQTACVECGTDLWISPESKKFAHSQMAMPCCAACAKRMAGEYAGQTDIRSVPMEFSDGGGFSSGQLQELEQELMKKIELAKAALESGMSPEHALEIAEMLKEAGIDEKTDRFEAMKKTAELAGTKMTRPEQSWGSVASMEDFDGTLSPAIPLQEMMDGMPKEIVARRVIPSLAVATHAKRVMFGMEAWGLKQEKPFTKPEMPIHDHPDRYELLILLDVRAEGVVKMYTAEIHRDGINPPTLGEWEKTDNPEGTGTFDGIFVDALIPTLQLVKQLHEMEVSD